MTSSTGDGSGLFAHCILLNRQVGVKKGRGLVQFVVETSEVEVLPGTLLVPKYISKGTQVFEAIDKSDANFVVEVNLSPPYYRRIANLSKEEYDLLWSVPSCSERLTVFSHADWLREGLQLKPGDAAYVDYHGRQHFGIVRYKGPLRGSVSTHFGVELNAPFQDGSDGTYDGERYFQCAPGLAAFVGLHSIRKSKENPVSTSAIKQEGQSASTSAIRPQAQAGNAMGFERHFNSSMKIGDRVVWMSETGPEFGTVKWIGVLPDVRVDGGIVGLEFDNPVGSGTGKYKDRQLFRARKGHASLVPMIGLMKEEEFLGVSEAKQGSADERTSFGDVMEVVFQGGTAVDQNKRTLPDLSLVQPGMWEQLEADRQEDITAASSQTEQAKRDQRAESGRSDMAPTAESSATTTKVQGQALPEEILKLDAKSVELYRQALAQGQVEDRDVRLMIVGHFGVGKSALRKRLLGQPVDINAREATDGIEVYTRRCKVNLTDGKWTQMDVDDKANSAFRRLAKLLEQHSSSQRQSPAGTEQHQVDDTEPIAAGENDMVSETVKDEPENSGGERVEIIYKRFDPHEPKTTNLAAPVEASVEMDDVLMELREVIKAHEPASDENTALVSIWDFAGQSPFYTTHQVYLTKRAIYLLVIDMSQHVDDMVEGDDCCFDSFGSKTSKVAEFVEFWLNSIHCYCSDSDPTVPPVILVGTHTDKLDQSKKDELIESYFGCVRNLFIEKELKANHVVQDEFSVDNSILGDPELTRLQQTVLEIAKQQQYWGKSIPATWICLEKTLAGLRERDLKVLLRAELPKINQSLPVPLASEEEMDLFLGYQHDLGTLLYFSDANLLDNILLDPQWVIDAMKCIITAKTFCSRQPKVAKLWKEFNSQAILKQDLIKAVWENTAFWDYRDYLQNLMLRLDLIARPCLGLDNVANVVEDNNKYFVPCALKEKPPADIFKMTDFPSTSHLCYTTKSRFIPAPVFNRLLAACLSKWPIFEQKNKPCIYYGCGIFQVTDNHQLSVYFCQDMIQTWVAILESPDMRPDTAVGVAVREFIHTSLRRIFASTDDACEIEQFIKCPDAELDSVLEIIDVDKFRKARSVACSFHDKIHVLKSSEILQGWFEDETDAASLHTTQVKEVGSEQPSSTVDKVDPAFISIDGLTNIQHSVGKIKFSPHNKLGRGARSDVYRGQLEDGRAIAVKCITCSSENDAVLTKEQMDKMYREMKIFADVEPHRHKNILGYYLSEIRSNTVYMALELCQGTLLDYVKAEHANWRSSCPPIEVNKGMAQGLEFLHSKKLAHRDLSPGNVLFVVHEDKIRKVCLGDFGNSKTTLNDMFSISGHVGTQGYIAPELYKAMREADGNTPIRNYGNTASDIFSLGILFYYSFTCGHHPFGQAIDCQANIAGKKDCSLNHLDDCDFTFQSLVSKMINHEPKERPNMKDVVNHPAFWSGKDVLDYLQETSDTIEAKVKSGELDDAPIRDPYLIPHGNWKRNLPANLQNYVDKTNVRGKNLYAGKGNSPRYLLRFIRNTEHHFKEYPADAQKEIGNTPEERARFWTEQCPCLLLRLFEVYKI